MPRIDDLKQLMQKMDQEYDSDGMHRIMWRNTKFVYCKCQIQGCNWEMWYTFCAQADGKGLVDPHTLFNL